MLTRIGAWCFRRRWVVLIGWLTALVAVIVLVGSVGTGFEAENEVPESDTKSGLEILDENFAGDRTGEFGWIVFTAPQGVDDPAVQAAMEDLFEAAEEIDGITLVSPYEDSAGNQTSADGTIAFAAVDVHGRLDQTESAEAGAEMRDAAPELEDLEVFVGGQALAEFEAPESELIGVAFAIIILILAFGSVVAMGIPIGVALVGVGLGLATATLASNGLTIPEFALTIGAMIGLGVGIDYALFIVTRYRERLHEGVSNISATSFAMDTAGRAVIFAGLTVVISLLGLLVIGLSFVTGLAVAAALTVLCTMAASITLLPALLGFAGSRIEVTRWRGAIAAGFVALAIFGVGASIQPLLIGLPIAVVILIAGTFVGPLHRVIPTKPPKPLRETGWYRFSRIIQARPWPAAIGGTLILLFLALPVLGLRLGFSDDGNAAEGSDQREAFDLLVEGFGPGFNGPLLIAVELPEPADFEVAVELAATLEENEGIAQVIGPIPNDPDNPTAVLMEVTPETSPQDEVTFDLVRNLRSDTIPSVLEGTEVKAYITGPTAGNVDFTAYLADRTLAFFAVVLLLSFLLLMVVFRSLLVPLKAVVMNILSIAAAYGVTVAAFQWGWLDPLLDTGTGAPIEPFIPMMMFAVVFGLSMDYEVFLLSRIKEEYDLSGDAVGSVADGLAATARVITAAAAIMVVVFGSFVFESDRVVRLFGFGLAVAVFLDATIVRMILVPATMELLGARNWWIPSWLDRILPNIQIEGHVTEEHQTEASDTEAMPVQVGAGEA
jgi:RND superfamily putative drug exporter